MAVYNGERFLRPAIESILDQTFTDFEFLIVDDASTDDTPAIIQSYQDSRIRVLRTECKSGAGYARNLGLRNARGEYVAVLDADDVAYPHRLATQAAFLDAHPEIALVGSAYDLIDESGARLKTVYEPTTPITIRWTLLFGGCIAHSTAMYRLPVALEMGGYGNTLLGTEDFALWGRMAAVYPMAQMNQALAMYRFHSSGLSRSSAMSLRAESIVAIVRQNIEACIGDAIPTQVAMCLWSDGVCTGGETLDQAYAVLWKCLITVTSERAKSRRDRRDLLDTSLKDLFRLARQSEEQRLRALRIAVCYGLCYAPESLLTLQFVRFAARVALPVWLRQVFRRK